MARGHASPEEAGRVRDEITPLQRAMWRAQRAGWVVMAAVIGVALTGALGGGGLGVATAAGPGFTLRYPGIARLHRPDPFQFRTAAGRDTLLAIELGGRFSDSWIIERIDPEPVRSIAGEHGERIVFRVDPGAPIEVEFHARPRRAGIARFDAGVNGTTLDGRSLVLP